MAGSFFTNVTVNLISKLGGYLFAPIGRQFGYVLCYKSHVEDLQNEVKELESARERVQCSVSEARNDAKRIHTDVEDWLRRVTEKAEEAQNLLERGKSAKNACFRGWIPNPVVRHPIGRKVKKTTEVIKGLQEKSRNINFKKVYYENSPPGIVTATTSATRSVDKKEDPLGSRALIIDDVMKAIADDKIHVIGVHGPGGVGKSRLLDDIKRRVQEEKLFDEIAMAYITRNPDIKRIQGEIADKLGLKLNNVETVHGRADRLRERLECNSKKTILIILDDLWKKLELKEVGIPCGDDDKVRGCKLLLTSRSKDVLCIDMSSDKEFQVNVLEHGEARRLFERTLGDKVNDPEFKISVDEVVNKCAGLPLYIVSSAKRLKRGNSATWRTALDIVGSDLELYVELNYKDIIDERIKSVFLVCALLSPEINLRDSLVYCMGLGLYEKFSKTIENARDWLRMDLHSLQDSSLLLDSDDKEWFRMHDIFVDGALSIACKEWNALVGAKGDEFKKWSEDELRKCKVISFYHVGIEELPEKLDCPNLKMLLLFEHNPSLKIPLSFFESMRKLQVLDIIGLSFASLPSSIEVLENLKSLCLDQCHLGDVTILGKLKGLQMLSFSDSTITFLPKEIGGLTKLRFLDLTRCTELKVIEPGMLGSLANLEELHMEDSFDQWEAEDEAMRKNVSLAELKNMKNLSTLSIAIPCWVNLLRDLPFGKLNKHIIQIGEVWDGLGEYKESRTLKLKLDSGNLLHEECVQKCLQRTQDLHLDGLQDGNDSIHDLCVEGFQELKYLHIQNSPSFQYVVYSEKNVQCIAFTTLVSFFLENLNNLKKICCGHLALESFGKLKIVKVDDCGEIKHLFPLSMTRILSQLEEIEISRCHSMQQIVTTVETEDGDEIDEDPKVRSYNLRRLTLRNLPKMTSFSKNADHSIDLFDAQQLMKLQCLEAITIERCQLIQEVFDLEGLTANGEVEILPRLRELNLSDLPKLGHIWNKNPQRASYFRNLRTLKVQNCDNLRFLFSSSMAKALGQIKEIEIESCELMEGIIDVQEEELEEAKSTDNLKFPMLTSLSLVKLPNLRTFTYGKYCIYCPSLTKLTISECLKMMTFSSFEERQQSMAADTGLRQAFGHINSGVSLLGFFNEKVLFPSLEELKLSSMCQLKRIWHNQLHGQSFCKLASFTVELCENLSYIFPSNLMDRLQSLNKIEVLGCPSLEALFDPVSLNSDKRQKPLVLSSLEKMKLLNLPKLKDILKSDCKVRLAFPSLMEVSIRRCHNLLYLFSSATAKTLDKLAVLDISCCNNLRGIIVMEGGKGKTIETFKFRHLSTLKLGDLENLISFCSSSCASDGLHPLFDEKLAFPKLEELYIKGVQQEELWTNKILEESFFCLKVLKVKQCHNLMNVIPSFMSKRLLQCMESLTIEECPRIRNLFTMSMAKSLRQLQYLGLGGCGEMEYILTKQEEKPEEATGKIVIPQLVALYLHNMPKLRSFCQGKHVSEWPSLKEFTIEDCKAVKVILGDASCRKSEDGDPTHQPLLLVEKVEFPSMESMKISHMDNVEKIWLDDLDSNAFSKLKTLVVEHCEKLSFIFSSYNMLTRFQNLERITVTDCGSLEVVFQVQEFNFIEAHSPRPFQLRELILMRLPKIRHVWRGLPQGGFIFGRLQCMEVIKCESLKSLFPSSVAKSMTRLIKLLVWECGVEEIIVEEDSVGMNAGDLFFPDLTDLRLLELPKLMSFFGSNHNLTWPLLKQLRVRHCGEMRSFSFAHEFQSCQGITTSENQSALFSFEKVIPQLEVLTLAREDVAMMPQHYIFHNIIELALACYHDENAAFPSNFLLHRFPNLKTLIVLCSSFEEIFPKDSFGHGGATPYGELIDMGKPLQTLRNLRRLDLHKLCNMKRVWKDGSLMLEILKQIEVLWVYECPSLSIVLPSPTSFQRLKGLGVQDCAGLVHMGTCSAVTSLVHLTWLILRNCVAMEDMVTDDGNGAKDISFLKLDKLILDGLPSLESFSPTNCTFRFPSLVCIVIMKCPKMNVFCKGALKTPNLDKVLLSEEDDKGCWEGNLNTTIQTLSA
ncbi:hypothetical protein BT93_F3308 [Corymbia citriodora subsp. variegata]|nr:hypothetical protein BT93_F3308 [Corymbia citriodora subsp. variegata]